MEGRDLIQLQHPKPTEAQSGFLLSNGYRFDVLARDFLAVIQFFFPLITLDKKSNFYVVLR